MKTQDRKNLIAGWPVYLLCFVLFVGMVILYFQKPARHGNEPLQDSIAKNIKGSEDPLRSLDDVINDRKSWKPVLPDWQGKELPNISFFDINGRKRTLNDYEGRQIILAIGATWYPPMKAQLHDLKDFVKLPENENPALIVLTVESTEAIHTFLKKNPYPMIFGSVEHLPEPFSLPDGFPCLFFIDTQDQLKLATVGLVPPVHIQAILTLPLPE